MCANGVGNVIQLGTHKAIFVQFVDDGLDLLLDFLPFHVSLLLHSKAECNFAMMNGERLPIYRDKCSLAG